MAETVTRRDIINLLREKYKLSLKDAKSAVKDIFSLIVDGLTKGARVELRNFGVFEIVQRKKKIGRNIKMKTPVNIPSRRVVKFWPGRLMYEYITKPSMEKPSVEPAEDKKI